jgi:hypothetical protein
MGAHALEGHSGQVTLVNPYKLDLPDQPPTWPCELCRLGS